MPGGSRQGSQGGNTWSRQSWAMPVCLCIHACASLCFCQVLLHGVVYIRVQENSEDCM